MLPWAPFGKWENGKGIWSCLLKSLIWIPVLPWGEWAKQPVHKFAGREKRSLEQGLSVQDEGGVPREMLRTRLCGALASSGERARLALRGY